MPSAQRLRGRKPVKVGGREAASAKAPGRTGSWGGEAKALDRDEPAHGQRLRVAGGSTAVDESESESRLVLSDSLWLPHGLYSPCNSPG